MASAMFVSRPIDLAAEYAKVDDELKEINDPLMQVNAMKHKLVAERQDHQRTKEERLEFKKDAEAKGIELGELRSQKAMCLRPLRIVGLRSLIEMTVDEYYPQGDSETAYSFGKPPKSSYLQSFNEIITSTDKRFTDQPSIRILRQRIIDKKMTPKEFMDVVRWLYSLFIEFANHKVGQLIIDLPEWDNVLEIKNALKCVQARIDTRHIATCQILLEPFSQESELKLITFDLSRNTT